MCLCIRETWIKAKTFDYYIHIVLFRIAFLLIPATHANVVRLLCVCERERGRMFAGRHVQTLIPNQLCSLTQVKCQHKMNLKSRQGGSTSIRVLVKLVVYVLSSLAHTWLNCPNPFPVLFRILLFQPFCVGMCVHPCKMSCTNDICTCCVCGGGHMRFTSTRMIRYNSHCKQIGREWHRNNKNQNKTSKKKAVIEYKTNLYETDSLMFQPFLFIPGAGALK